MDVAANEDDDFFFDLLSWLVLKGRLGVWWEREEERNGGSVEEEGLIEGWGKKEEGGVVRNEVVSSGSVTNTVSPKTRRSDLVTWRIVVLVVLSLSFILFLDSAIFVIAAAAPPSPPLNSIPIIVVMLWN